MSNYTLPTYFEVNEELFEIRNQGDFRIVLSCFNILYDDTLSEQEKIYTCLIVFYENFDDVDDILNCSVTKELVEKMFWFFDCGDSYKSDKQKPRLIDWDKDSTLIISAINNVAKKEVRNEESMHWWTFIGYYMAIGECPLSQIVAIRNKIATGKKLEKYEKEFRDENPQYFDIDFRTNEEKQFDDWIEALWEGSK